MTAQSDVDTRVQPLPDVLSESSEASVSNEPEPTIMEEPPRDDEGLLLSYDVIICGTGLVQSILASALTRAGKSVLHCDGQDHYGELDTVWTFPYLQELLQKEKGNKKVRSETTNAKKGDDQINLSHQGSYQSLQFHSSGQQTNFSVTKIGSLVQTPYGHGQVLQSTIPTSEKSGGVAVALSKWKMADGKSPTVFFGVTEGQLASFIKTGKAKEEAMEEYFQTKPNQDLKSLRSLDAKRILEQQSRSLALDVSPCLLYASGAAVQGMLASQVAEHLEFQTMQAVYWLHNKQLEKVPCSKGDVFQSALLPPLDKRRFMKFFQLAMDYATERELQHGPPADTANQEVDNAITTEEGVLSLNERQLNQGRSLARPQNKAISQKELQVLYDCVEQNMEFDLYLQQHAKLSDSLRNLIRHALALQHGQQSLSTRDGMDRLCDHLKALGRYGTTAFLTSLYGSGEMSQFFCRSAAVYGATYLLRRIPSSISVDSQEGDIQCVQGVTLVTSEGDDFPGGPPKEKHIRATHVVVANDAIKDATMERRVVRRISILCGLLVPDTPRAIVIIPPGGVGDNSHAIHGLVLDESSNVAPAGCSVVHLTTVAEDVEKSSCLDMALQYMLESSPAGSTPDEIFHTTFSYGLCEDHKWDIIQGLHVIQRPAMPLVVDEAFEQARKIFMRICDDNKEFLGLSDEMQVKLKEQLQDAYRGPHQSEDDDEQVALESAMGMLS